MTRTISTCDHCLRDGQPCTVFEEGVFCDVCQALAPEEERADTMLAWLAAWLAAWEGLLVFGVVLWVLMAVIYFLAHLLP